MKLRKIGLSGAVLLVEIDAPGAEPRVERIAVASSRGMDRVVH